MIEINTIHSFGLYQSNWVLKRVDWGYLEGFLVKSRIVALSVETLLFEQIPLYKTVYPMRSGPASQFTSAEQAAAPSAAQPASSSLSRLEQVLPLLFLLLATGLALVSHHVLPSFAGLPAMLFIGSVIGTALCSNTRWIIITIAVGAVALNVVFPIVTHNLPVSLLLIIRTTGFTVIAGSLAYLATKARISVMGDHRTAKSIAQVLRERENAWTVTELSALFQIPYREFYELVDRGELEAFGPIGALRICPREIERWYQSSIRKSVPGIAPEIS
ncbi:helix-turn-helix domain-containing protein [Terriglobus albidus]|uniref:helix-turn-helix domain-containing protein n=1 Tax=Terriglobus albidus TaxID=1592106 RepID=UPI0021DF706B|nr:helix-turn-helix domain-containing protein [Terriglobus albidus]